VRARRSIPHRASAASTGKEKQIDESFSSGYKVFTHTGARQFLDKIHFRAE
jgi:hypothetical protein